MVTGQGYGLGIGGCKRLCRHGRGAWLGYTAFPVWSVKDRSLHKPSRQVTDLIIPSTYWCMGAWKTCCSLVADLALSGPTVRVLFWWRRSLHRTESGTQGRGLGVLVWTGT